VAEWKKKNQVPLLELPSGCQMRVRKIGLQTLMSMGVVPNSLMGIASKAIGKGETGVGEAMSDQQLMDLVENPKQVKEISDFMDQMLCLVAAEPVIHPLPAPGVERDLDLLYVDEVDEEDKMFVFQVVTGGTTNIEEFRRETGSTMAAIRGREDVELPS
jgi:hypothetical protein